MSITQTATGTHFLAGRYDAASSWAEKALQQNSNYLPGIRMAAASHALAGRLVQAQKALTRMRQIDAELRISNLAELVPFVQRKTSPGTQMVFEKRGCRSDRSFC